ETSVASYWPIAMPQNSEKFASICVNWLVERWSDDDRPAMTFSAPSTTWVEFHHFAWKPARIMSAYVVLRPVPPATAIAPSRLSVFDTIWPSSGVRPSIFLPSLSQSRPAADISVLLFGGPTACDAVLALFSSTATWLTSPRSLATSTRAPASAAPNGLRPLNMLFARPSQKLRTLKTALIADGVLRPVMRRVLTPPTLNVGSGCTLMSSRRAPETSLNSVFTTPCEPPTSSKSRVTADRGSTGFASWWNGKSAAVNAWFGPPMLNAPLAPAASWFF